MASNGGLSVHIASLETHSFILHCTKLNILCPLVYIPMFSVPTSFGKFVIWKWHMSHTRKQNHVVVTQIDNKCRAPIIFYKYQEPLPGDGHIFTISRIPTLVAAKCPFKRGSQIIPKMGPKHMESRTFAIKNHFFRESRRA